MEGDKKYIELEAAKQAIMDYIAGHTVSKFPTSELCRASMMGAEGAMYELELVPAADVMEVKQIEIIRDDLKWWLETNTEKGVVFIPKFVVENMIAKMGA